MPLQALQGDNVDPGKSNDGQTGEAWMIQTQVLILSIAELAIVSALMLISLRANRGGWNEKAIRFRYVAELQRIGYYLPRAGSFRPPSVEASQFASRIVRQSSMNWLHDAIFRSVYPVDVEPLATESHPNRPALLATKPKEALASMDKHWLGGQIIYHHNTDRAMGNMSKWLNWFALFVTILVFVIVVTDVAMLLLNVPSWLRMFTPYIVLLSAVLPALVASLNGLRLQAECRRLSDRSKALAAILEGCRETAKTVQHNMEPSSVDDLGSWTPDVIRFAEEVARHTLAEVAEWSVVYAKEDT